ncbi:MAG: hypothetical protein EXR27_05235 [Betaproteobacteria bacterium]|nr:hypothetical protein [Betaproteobacteria bacterium]
MITWDRVLKTVEIGFLIFGAYLGYEALNSYKSQAKIAVLNRLDEADNKLVEMQVAHPHVATFYADLNSSLPAKKQADLYLALVAGCGNPLENKSCSRQSGQLPTWKTIPDLECAIWSGTDFNSDTKRKLREGALHAEAVLYLVARAYERKSVIGQDEYDTWSSYILDRGHHPLLLLAIHYGYMHGYVTKEFSVELKRLLSQTVSPRAWKSIETIYPQFGSGEPSAMRGKVSCS